MRNLTALICFLPFALFAQTTPRYFSSSKVIGPYSPAVQIGNYLYVSGQIGLNPETMELVSDDIQSQTKQALANLKNILLSAGYDSSHVVQCTVYLKDMNDFQSMNAIYGAFFVQGKYPVRTTVEVAHLPKNARIEITATAYK